MDRSSAQFQCPGVAGCFDLNAATRWERMRSSRRLAGLGRDQFALECLGPDNGFEPVE
jgi:hypothetical protein